jgi:hypothetical protein
MSPTRHLWVPLIVLGLVAPLAGTALGMQQDSSSLSSEPSPIEQALIDRRCNAVAPGTDVYQACLDTQLQSLRTDFGRNLSRLSASQRKSLDTVCNKVRAVEGRDAYVACLSAELLAMRGRPGREEANPAETAVPSTPPGPSADAAAPPAAGVSSRSTGLWFGASLVVLGAGAAGAFYLLKSRRLPPAVKCRVCGNDVGGQGDLCPNCRRDAAEALRRAAAERADAERAHEEAQRQQRAREEEDRRQRAREEEEARVREQERAREEARARQEEELRRREEETRLREAEGVEPEEPFDPYVILGVPRGASVEAIQAAYEEARSRYDSENVAYLGPELQEHFKRKAKAVERAFQMLTG